MPLAIDAITLKTRQRLKKFSQLRDSGQSSQPGEFWDYVVVTAIDAVQKESYRVQLDMKLRHKELPLSAKYIVIADPPGAKIGNGGSTLFVIEQLVNEHGLQVLDKKIIIVHAGGFSQRLPNASVLGKAFLGIPIGEPMYQALDLKLSSYIDFPQKMRSGGIFVCSADTFEVYDDCGRPWTFASEGFTALAHKSHTSIGETHGVFVLDQPTDSHGIVWDCKKFLHKPTTEQMTATPYCIVCEEGNEKWIMTDSAFFISKSAATKLLEFHRMAAPLSCEIDAYGDFLQALGKQSTPDYVKNVKNVCHESGSLIETRLKIYELLKNTPLYAIVLASSPQYHPQKSEATNHPNSIFYHLGTMSEYQYHFCQDEAFRTTVGVGPLTASCGIPYFISTENENHSGSTVGVTRQGALSCSIQQTQCSTPCIMGSVIGADVTVGEGTVIEYCVLGGGVVIGNNCILSNCHVPESTIIPDGVFMCTAAILVNGDILYVTVLFECGADMKKAVPLGPAPSTLFFFGKPLETFIQAHAQEESVLGLWNAKLFPAAKTMEKSCSLAYDMLRKIGANHKSVDANAGRLYSIKEVLHMKDTKSTLLFREALTSRVQREMSSSQLNDQ